MTEFAVLVDGDPLVKGKDGVEREQAYWVLSVDPVGERLLMACTSGSLARLRWVAISDCRIGRAATPEMPRPVFALQPPNEQRPVIVEPQLLRKFNGR